MSDKKQNEEEKEVDAVEVEDVEAVEEATDVDGDADNDAAGSKGDSVEFDEDLVAAGMRAGASTAAEAYDWDAILDQNRDIPNYDAVDEETREKMDFIIDDVDLMDQGSLMSFGKGALDEWHEMADIVANKCSAEGVFAQDLSDIQNQMEEKVESFSLSGLAESAADATGKAAGKAVRWGKKNKDIVAGAGAGAAAGTFLPIPFIGTIGGGLAGAGAAIVRRVKGKKKDETDSKLDKKLEEETRNQVLDTRELRKSLEEGIETIPGIIDSINQLGKARVESYKNVCLVIGAGIEMCKRLEGVMIPEAARKAEELRTSEAQEELAQLEFAKTILHTRVNNLMGIQVNNQMCQQSLLTVRDLVSQTYTELAMFIDEAAAVWTDQNAQAGLTLMASKMAALREKASKHASKLSKNHLALTRQTAQIVKESAGKGAIDTEELKSNAKELLNLNKDMLSLADQRKRLREDTENIVEAHGTANEALKQRTTLALAGPKGEADKNFALTDKRDAKDKDKDEGKGKKDFDDATKADADQKKPEAQKKVTAPKRVTPKKPANKPDPK